MKVGLQLYVRAYKAFEKTNECRLIVLVLNSGQTMYDILIPIKPKPIDIMRLPIDLWFLLSLRFTI